jgi:hypothetical protein
MQCRQTARSIFWPSLGGLLIKAARISVFGGLPRALLAPILMVLLSY